MKLQATKQNIEDIERFYVGGRGITQPSSFVRASDWLRMHMWSKATEEKKREMVRISDITLLL